MTCPCCRAFVAVLKGYERRPSRGEVKELYERIRRRLTDELWGKTPETAGRSTREYLWIDDVGGELPVLGNPKRLRDVIRAWIRHLLPPQTADKNGPPEMILTAGDFEEHLADHIPESGSASNRDRSAAESTLWRAFEAVEAELVAVVEAAAQLYHERQRIQRMKEKASERTRERRLDKRKGREREALKKLKNAISRVLNNDALIGRVLAASFSVGEDALRRALDRTPERGQQDVLQEGEMVLPVSWPGLPKIFWDQERFEEDFPEVDAKALVAEELMKWRDEHFG